MIGDYPKKPQSSATQHAIRGIGSFIEGLFAGGTSNRQSSGGTRKGGCNCTGSRKMPPVRR